MPSEPKIIRIDPPYRGAGPVNHRGRPRRIEAWGVLDDGSLVALVREGNTLVPADGKHLAAAG
jgi:hypothetical protein